MALPEGITGKTLTFGVPTSAISGRPATGSVTLTAPKNLVHVPTGTPLFSGKLNKQFTGLTEVTFTDLVPTDHPDLNRVDWTYTLEVRVNGAVEQPDPIVFVLPDAGPDTVDVDTLVEVPSSAGTPVSVDVLTTDVLPAQMATVAADNDSDFAVGLRAAFVAGSVYENDGTTVSATKRLSVILTADGTDIEDLIIEDVA